MAAERFVYIVDDDPAIRRSLERLLDAVGFQVASYATPKAFLGVAGDLAVGCVLLDLRMPEMDGLEVQARLLLINPDLPVIVMTAQGDVQTAVRAMKAGAVDFIEKPYSDDALIAAIESALKAGAAKGRADDIAAAAAADRYAQSTRAAGSRGAGGRAAKQGHCLQSRHQRAHGRGSPLAHDGPPGRASARPGCPALRFSRALQEAR